MSLANDGVPFTMNVEPAGSNNNNSGWGGDWGAWIILFLIFGMFGWGGFGGWGGGFGGGGAAQQGYDTRADLQRGFDNQAVISKLDGITQGICDSTYALNNTMTNGFHGVDNAICSLGNNMQQGFNATNVALMQGQNALQSQLADCCCENRAAIAQVRYDMATQACDTRNTIQNTTRDVIDNANQNSRAILQALNDNYVRTLERENNDLRMSAMLANSNAVNQAARDAQTAELLRRTGHDCPTAAYIVQPPTPVNFPTNCCGAFTGYNGGCGTCA